MAELVKEFYHKLSFDAGGTARDRRGFAGGVTQTVGNGRRGWF